MDKEQRATASSARNCIRQQPQDATTSAIAESPCFGIGIRARMRNRTMPAGVSLRDRRTAGWGPLTPGRPTPAAILPLPPLPHRDEYMQSSSRDAHTRHRICSPSGHRPSWLPRAATADAYLRPALARTQQVAASPCATARSVANHSHINDARLTWPDIIPL